MTHKLFGFATVSGEPVAEAMPASTLDMIPRRWSIPVEWDDKTRAPSRVDGELLQKVPSSSAKGAQFWHGEWQKLRNAHADARAQTDAMLTNSFRSSPPFSRDQLLAHLECEEIALANLIEFLRGDAAGEHE